MIKDWLVLLEDMATNHPDKAIAVHCVAGLGRSVYSPFLCTVSCAVQEDVFTVYVTHVIKHTMRPLHLLVPTTVACLYMHIHVALHSYVVQ